MAKTFRELLDACGQGEIDSCFNDDNFPLEPHLPGDDEWEVYEHRFPFAVHMDLGNFSSLERAGFRLCGPRRAMEFVAAHPELQLDHPIVVTAYYCELGGLYMPVFSAKDGKRVLTFGAVGSDFSPRFGWLLLCRK